MRSLTLIAEARVTADRVLKDSRYEFFRSSDVNRLVDQGATRDKSVSNQVYFIDPNLSFLVAPDCFFGHLKLLANCRYFLVGELEQPFAFKPQEDV